MAKRAETTQALISQIEAGFGGVKLETVDRVIKALGIRLFTPISHEAAAGN